MALDIRKFIDRFVEEAREHVARLGEGLAALEHDPSDKETINVIFRAAHTVKGSSKMLKLHSINETAHKLEDLLDAVRNGSLAFGPELGKLLYRGVDAVSDLVERLARGEELPPADSGLLAALEGALQPGPAGGAAGAPAPCPPDLAAGAAVPEPPPGAAPDAGRAVAAEARLRTPDTVRVRLAKLDELIKLMNEVVSSHTRSQQRVVDIRAIERLQFRADMGDRERLQLLQQEIHRFSQQVRDDTAAQELLIGELHGKALIMRMLPLAMVFDPMGRMVRDIAQSLGKDVECLTSGSEIELDRQMIDTLSDPILHLLRNSVDHGIELPEIRRARGKAPRGRVTLAARQDGAWVLIEISDDGAGIPVAAIRDKAVRKGFVSPERLAAMSDAEAIDLIFLPGFSTSPIITDISGRGVGLDVVKSAIVEGLQGIVSVDSRLGEGTVFTLRLPLSLAVMRVLQVRAGGIPFGFTAQYIVEILRADESDFRMVAGRQVVIVRNEFIPVAALHELLHLPEGRNARRKKPLDHSGSLLLTVCVRHEKMALVVDELVDERDMVIKPLPVHLRRLSLVSGMVTTGKNELVSVLHVPVLLELAKAARGEAGAQAADAGPAPRRKSAHVLVVDDSINTREIERDVLEAHGYEVTLAEDGQDGLRKARATRFDAVLTDVEMPHMDGFTLTERLRQEEEYGDTPIIILSSRQKDEDKRRGIQAGADAYIVKGDFDQSNLVEILRNFGL